ncbi:MAG: RES family NAD+ phosphorylase [Pseudomonadota bacterium]
MNWAPCLAVARPTVLLGTLKRMVESQKQVATLPLVDSLDEHQVLETLLEDSKPALPDSLARLDYLLRSPWRYPPLPWGSRFGTRYEPGLFYGALSNAALFAETAFYRLVFLDGPRRPLAGRVTSQHTLFSARYRAEAGYDLTSAPFAEHQAVLTDPQHYTPCQALGTALRAAGAEAFIYRSARVAEREAEGNNIALLTPAALRSRRHLQPQPVLCEATTETVSLRHGDRVHRFARAQFLVDGVLPMPA